MIQYLPHSKFKRLNQKEIDKFDVSLISNNSLDDGYILEVNLEYPKKLHEFHNNYLLLSERFEINHDILSKYCSIISNKFDKK